MTDQQDNQIIEGTTDKKQFVEYVREDGTIEMRHPNYDELIAREEEPNDNPVVISDEQIALDELNTIRAMRNTKLKETDWWAVGDRTMTQEQIDYRQALRDITETYSSREDVVWPELPEV